MKQENPFFGASRFILIHAYRIVPKIANLLRTRWKIPLFKSILTVFVSSFEHQRLNIFIFCAEFTANVA
jgi:hypothetical protein